jgi:hypothetical protein
LIDDTADLRHPSARYEKEMKHAVFFGS